MDAAAGAGPADGHAEANSSAWRLTLPCTRTEAEAIALADVDGAVLAVTEEDEAAARWRLDAYFEGEPDAGTLAAVRALVAAPGDALPAPLGDEDWVTLSQAGLEPIREGRFVVHTAACAVHVDRAAGERAFVIDAGLAFGTGHHETTAGCLLTLDALSRSGRRFGRIIDLGTGTGLLAFAAAELWPTARVTATDIDPVAIEVTRGNAAANDVVVGDDIGEVALIVADGARDPAIEAAAPYDLVIANILAGPLVAMAAEVAAIAAPGAALVLAGLLTRQAEDMLAAYAAAGCAEAGRLERGDWTILHLGAGACPAGGAVPAGDRDGWARDGR